MNRIGNWINYPPTYVYKKSYLVSKLGTQIEM